MRYKTIKFVVFITMVLFPDIFYFFSIVALCTVDTSMILRLPLPLYVSVCLIRQEL